MADTGSSFAPPFFFSAQGNSGVVTSGAIPRPTVTKLESSALLPASSTARIARTRAVCSGWESVSCRRVIWKKKKKEQDVTFNYAISSAIGKRCEPKLFIGFQFLESDSFIYRGLRELIEPLRAAAHLHSN